MKIRLHNDEDNDYVDYEGTLKEIEQQAKTRLTMSGWKHGWSEVMKRG